MIDNVIVAITHIHIMKSVTYITTRIVHRYATVSRDHTYTFHDNDMNRECVEFALNHIHAFSSYELASSFIETMIDSTTKSHKCKFRVATSNRSHETRTYVYCIDDEGRLMIEYRLKIVTIDQ